MTNYLLIAVNSQYVHTNLAVRYLKAYGEKYSEKKIEIYESNINNQISQIIKDIYNKNPKVVVFSKYIWNRDYVFKIIKELKKILPETKIGIGGPEATYIREEELSLMGDSIDFIIKGEGERAVLDILKMEIEEISGVYTHETPSILDEIPFPYTDEEIQTSGKILYYESSRGCPFSCSYCLSSIDCGIKYFSIERVKSDLNKFLKSDVKLLKFVDRTFNINKGRYMEIWSYLLKNYREGITFHFEINANILDDESIKLLEQVPNGYFQFEIGVQSINEKTMESIKRRNLLDRLESNVKRINKNIHLHLDLIVGLPYETYDIFKKSFNYVYDLQPEMIQLGFLKILQGTKISLEIEKYNYKYLDFTPYEVLSNNFISYGEVSKLKEFEKVLDWYYNSEKFKFSLNYIVDKFYTSSFDFFQELSEYFKKNSLLDIGHKDISLFQYIVDFSKSKDFFTDELYNCLKYDYLKNGKPGVYPNWIISEKDSDLYDELIRKRGYKSIREGHKNSEYEIFNYNIFQNKKERYGIFFDYIKDTIEVISLEK